MRPDLIPDSAPFSPEQRAWLNGFFSGVLGLLDESAAKSLSVGQLQGSMDAESTGSKAAEEEEAFPWHDSSLSIDERMQLADGKPLARQMMAAMAQLNCGSCGYLCKTYAESIASGQEKNLTLCSPGGSDTAKRLRLLSKQLGATASSASSSIATAVPGTRNHPVEAKLLESKPLNYPDSAKDTRHVRIDLSKTPIQYRVGDALGILPTNCEQLVGLICDQQKWEVNQMVDIEGQPLRLGDVLKTRCLRSITEDLVSLFQMEIDQALQSAACDAAVKESWIDFLDSADREEWDVLELCEAFSWIRVDPAAFAKALLPLRPRLYSIASSIQMHPGEVHLTVGRVEEKVRGRARKGVASTMLSDRLVPGASLQVFLQPSHGFTIPSDGQSPMIMVGPGTGIAPFIAFLQQRWVDQSPGKNWLFFGNQRREHDFLYREELERWQESGFLTRLDLAFSRDGAEKVYVQHRMLENAAELYRWLQQGAHFYICGDAKRMAKDVEHTLLQIIGQQGQMTDEEAVHYLKQMHQDQRYRKDVY